MNTHYNKPISVLAIAYRNGSRFAVQHPTLGWQTYTYLPYNADSRSAYSIKRDGSLTPVEIQDEYSQIMQDQGIC